MRQSAASKRRRGKPRTRHLEGRGKGLTLDTVSVPAPFRPAFHRAQDYVARYFVRKVANPRRGTISISGERYILVRAASMSVEFFDLVRSLYADQGVREARTVASNLLFDVAHAIGRADARTFHARMKVSDPIAKLSAGPIHFSFAGWAYVDIFPESHPSPDEDFYLIYEHPYSFESDAWVHRRRRSDGPVCIMNAGYSSGWCEESFGLHLVSVEVECVAAGGKRCRFVMAPPSRIEEHLARYAQTGARRRKRSADTTGLGHAPIPEFFKRKRLEDELRRSHQDLEKRVAERTAALRSANERLRREIAERRRAEEIRDEFLSVAAHELKTPLTSLRGFAQLLLRQAGDSPVPGRLRPALDAVDRQSAKLGVLVGQLLDVSRFEAGRLAVDRRMTDLVPLVRGVVDAAGATTKRHRFQLRGPAVAMAFADPLRLEQVVTNVVENAVKYSPKGGPVNVEISKDGARVRVEVADSGLGVPPEHRARIFDRYFQAHTARRLGGMGLGLYISRQIVELHGGAIDASFPDTGGTCISISIPAKRRSGKKR
jgi:signal transduction histidine kinase/predicted hydrocarbon binding protein